MSTLNQASIQHHSPLGRTEGEDTSSRWGSEWARVYLDGVLAELGAVVNTHRNKLNEMKIKRTEAAMDMTKSAASAIGTLAVISAATTGVGVGANVIGAGVNMKGAKTIHGAENGVEKNRLIVAKTTYQNTLNPGSVVVPVLPGVPVPAAIALPSVNDVANAKVNYEAAQTAYNENRDAVRQAYEGIPHKVDFVSKMADVGGSLAKGPQESARETLHQGTQVLNALDSQLEQAKGSLDGFIREIYQAGSRYRDIGGVRR